MPNLLSLDHRIPPQPKRAFLTFLLATIGIACLTPILAAQQLQTDLWVTDGEVDAVVRSGGVIYVGGDFGEIGPATGALLSFEEGANAAIKPYPWVVGMVRVVVPDGNGGVYIGGTFTAVRGEPRNHLAQLDANGNLTSWNPNPSNEVWAIVPDGGLVYVSGFFTSIGAQERWCLAALDPTTGEATSWDPHADNGVMSLAVVGDTVYAGGAFTAIGGQPRNRLAAIDRLTGLATDWNPNVTGPQIQPAVEALVVNGGRVYAAGIFDTVGGLTRRSLAAIDVATGAVKLWNPRADNGSGSPYILTLAISGGTLYAGGIFQTIGGQPRNGLAALNTTDASATSWDPQTPAMTTVDHLLVDGNTVYVGGQIASLGGQSRHNLASLDATTGVTTSWDPNVSGEIVAIALEGGKVYAGGSPSGSGKSGGFLISAIDQVPRHNLAAFDAATGEVTSWSPDVSTYQGAQYAHVYALAVDGNTVYTGGRFDLVGGQPRSGLAAIDASTGIATSWDPAADHVPISHLALGNGTLYVTGEFTSIGGQPRNAMAALLLTTGAATDWDPNPDGPPDVLLVSGGTVYAGGCFTSIGGRSRDYLAALDAITGNATTWNSHADDCVSALAINGGTLYAGGTFTSIGHQPRNHIAALDAASANATSWDPNADGGVQALAISGTTVCVGGQFTSIGGLGHDGLAAVDATTGQSTLWHPHPEGDITALATSGDTIYAGGNFASMSSAPFEGIAGFAPRTVVGVETPVTTLPMLLRATPNPFSHAVALQFVLPERGDVEVGVFDLAGRVVRHLQPGELAAGEQRLIWDGRSDAGRDVSTGLYVARVQAGSFHLNTKVFLLR